MRWIRILGVSLVILVLAAATLTACFGGDDGEVLTVLAGSELRDLEPLFDQIADETGLRLEMEYIGTLDGAEKLISGLEVDLAWFSHGKYLTLLQGAGSRVIAQEKIMLSPVVLGVKESKARAWGWVDNPTLTWREIEEKAQNGELRFAMTNPASSNSGFTALVGVASALAGTGRALEVADIDNAALRDFFRGQALTAGSSGWLAEAYVREQDRLDGMINYESVLLKLNADGQLNEPLYLVYPQEGIITADYPLMLINNAKREHYETLVAYLRTPEFQQTLMEQTLRRPVIPQVQVSSQFPSQLLVELPFPNSADVIDQLLIGYLDEQRVPAHAIFVLDVSGSMEGDRLDDLKAALIGLTGVDQSLTGQFSRFRNRERITLITFNSGVTAEQEFVIDNPEAQSAEMAQIRSFADGLRANGGTAIYSALQRAYYIAIAAQQRDPERYYSIVLMSDGESNEGIRASEFERFFQQMPPEVQDIHTFTILFGDAEEEAMQELAELTGGRMFDAQSEALSLIFKQIRGYQ